MIVIDEENLTSITIKIDSKIILEADVGVAFVDEGQTLIVSTDFVSEEDIDTQHLLNLIGLDFPHNPMISVENWEQFNSRIFNINGKKYLQLYFSQK